MVGIAGEYKALMNDFLDGVISTVGFQTAFLTKFKNENRKFEGSTFYVLDELFGDIDSFTSDANLIAEDPSFYLNEDQLRRKVIVAVGKLKCFPLRGRNF
jgi:hypothetical protein